MNTCQVCIRPFTLGKKGCCSKDCYMQILQERLDDCFRRDTSHSKVLAS